jgi:glycosyltransferase involved in cell wall biosynthesis
MATQACLLPLNDFKDQLWSTKVRVLHVIPGIAPRYGGPSRAALEMCRALRSEGCEVLLATTDADGESQLAVELGKILLYDGVPAIFFLRQWSEVFQYSRSLSDWLRGNVGAFDVVHIHAVFSHSSLAAASICRRGNVPYIMHPLGSLAPWSLKQKRVRKLLFWYVAARRMLKNAAAIHYTTAKERRWVEEYLGLSRGVVIPLGADERLISNATLGDEFLDQYPLLANHPYLVMLCRLHPVKGLELFIEIFLELTHGDRFKGWKLVIAGDGKAEYVESLKELVRQRDGIDRVIFTGWLNDSEKAPALRGAELFAAPSQQESFGLSVVEAMACGTPVLISDQVNLAEEVESAGAGWVFSLDRAALRQALAEAMRDEEELSRRGSAGRELIRSRFTWPSIAKELTRLYQQIVNNANSRL